MLQSLAHLMITALSLDCGYSASAIRERVYASRSSGYGILLYIGTPGSEGTLGGLVDMGKHIGRHLARALELGALAGRMDREPALAVRLCVDIKRKEWDERPAAAVVERFASEFRDQIWPGQRYPEVFYDPRSLSMDWTQRASLHAKCVVADERYALVTSANFSEAAGARNIETGVRLDDSRFAGRVTRQFDLLLENRVLQRVDLGLPMGLRRRE